jgi:hypothetical protein
VLTKSRFGRLRDTTYHHTKYHHTTYHQAAAARPPTFAPLLRTVLPPALLQALYSAHGHGSNSSSDSSRSSSHSSGGGSSSSSGGGGGGSGSGGGSGVAPPPASWRPQFFAHQARAIDALCAGGQHVVLATPTSSGKSLAYNVPVLKVGHMQRAVCLY